MTTILRVKEKLGELRVYPVPRDPDADEAVRVVAAQCAKACEACGAVGGLLSDGGWLRVRCFRHRADKIDSE